MNSIDNTQQQYCPHGVAEACKDCKILWLQERENVRIGAISTAAIGAWKEGDSIHPDYDTVALHDVAQLYARYEKALSDLAPYLGDADYFPLSQDRVEGLDIPTFLRGWFRVEVSDEEGQVVAIEKESLAGRDIGPKEKAVIRRSISHLTGFLGDNLHAASGRDCVREGWKLVPVEPTTEMLEAACKSYFGDAVYKNVSESQMGVEEGEMYDAYKAMLAAAPSPGSGEKPERRER